MIYFIKSGYRVKIGCTVNLPRRLRDIRFALPKPGHGELIAVCDGFRPFEQAIHRRYEASRSAGEWFYYTPDIQRYVRNHTSAPDPALAARVKRFMSDARYSEGWGPGYKKRFPTDTAYLAA